MVHRGTGIDITVLQLIRAGVVQKLLLCVLLDVKCYSPTHRIRREKKAEELNPNYWRDCPTGSIDDVDVVYAYGCFVLPPRHVFAFQTKETVRVNSVTSLDGQDVYFPGVDVSRDALQIMLPHLNAFIAHIKASQAAQQATAPATSVQATETKEQRQDRRLKACIDAGLPMNERAASLRLPDGVANIAESEGVTRQSFSTDVKAALKRRENAKREGVTVHRA